MKTLVVLSTFLLLCCLSCKTSEENQKANLSKVKVEVSPRTRLFLDDLSKLSDKNGQYILSDDFIEKYSLREMDGKFYVGGMMKVNSSFNPESGKPLDMKIGSRSGNILTVQLPLSRLAEILNKEDIEYFEISRSAQLKD